MRQMPRATFSGASTLDVRSCGLRRGAGGSLASAVGSEGAACVGNVVHRRKLAFPVTRPARFSKLMQK
eukprot:6213868-Pleurochrysis_carterae.AAC.5